MGKVVAVITGATGGIGQEFVRQILNDKKVDAVCPGWVDTEMPETQRNGKKIYFPGITSAKTCDEAVDERNRGLYIKIRIAEVIIC
ncbi:MAG: hypothetical protein IJ763_03960 [Lachnospiraceae bacterium]|nr:hypothetical protein [Lachnospiraceae bacterium]